MKEIEKNDLKKKKKKKKKNEFLNFYQSFL